MLFRSPGTSEAFMSPYMQAVVDAQQREAIRQSDIAGTQMAGQATQAGAFGGSRYGLQEAERQRNLATQLGQIQATGLQNAFQNAQQQFNQEQQNRLQAQQANLQAQLSANQLRAQQQQYGAGLGLQGLQAAMGGASQLGNLGTTQLQNQLRDRKSTRLNSSHT